MPRRPGKLVRLGLLPCCNVDRRVLWLHLLTYISILRPLPICLMRGVRLMRET